MNSICWRDLLFAALIGITFLFISVLASIVKHAEEVTQASKPVGNMVVMLIWPSTPNDVDCWVLGPEEPHAVGYSAKSGVNLDLLRDDLGLDPTEPFHFETVISRGIIPGEYVINAHLYRGAGKLPVPLILEVDMNDGLDGHATRTLLKAEATLDHEGEERTLIRFVLSKDGNIVPGSVSHLFKPLREATHAN